MSSYPHLMAFAVDFCDAFPKTVAPMPRPPFRDESRRLMPISLNLESVRYRPPFFGHVSVPRSASFRRRRENYHEMGSRVPTPRAEREIAFENSPSESVDLHCGRKA